MTDVPGSAPVGNPSNSVTGAASSTDAPTASTQAPSGETWTSSLQNPEIKGFAELKGFKSPEAVVEAYRNLEKMQGVPAERLAKIPEQGDAAGWTDFNKRFGWDVPTDTKDYQLPVPEGMGADFSGEAAKWMQEAGIPKDKAKQLATRWNEYALNFAKTQDAAIAHEHSQDGIKLRQEWGANYDRLNQVANAAIAEFQPKTGLTNEQMEGIRDIIGSAQFMKFWAGIGSAMGEAKFVQGEGHPANGAMTPDAARVRLEQIGRDKEWFSRFEKGSVKEVQEYQRLRETVANATIQQR